MALKAHKSTWLFDCGEASQRQVHKQPMIRHGKLDRIFLTNRRANNVLGLPGAPLSSAKCSAHTLLPIVMRMPHTRGTDSEQYLQTF